LNRTIGPGRFSSGIELIVDPATPTARALLTLELIQTSPGITADRLAAELGVSDRAARRYVAMLRVAGVSIDATTGPYGGYRIGRGLRLPPLTFSTDEAIALVMAALDGHHETAGPGNPVSSALAKIMRALPEGVAAKADAVRRSAAPAPDRAAARPDPTITTALIEAAELRRPARLDYRPESGSATSVDVEPWAVVVRHARWYLLCRSVRADAVRAYRIDRVAGVELLPGSYVPPPDLNAVRALEEHLASGWDYTAEIVIEAPLDQLKRVPRTLGRLERIDDSTTRLSGSTSSPRWYVEQLASIPAPFRIVGAAEIRAAAAELAQRLLA
jgi:predicted DNA-binding transcriptional regulator YafY